MIVVDGAARYIGQQITVHVDRMHQTVAGKMAFAHTVSKPDNKPESEKSERPAGTTNQPEHINHSKPSLHARMRH
jgi:hypothetical protein